MEIKVLIADDDKILRNLLRDIMNKEGYTVLEASDGQEAMDVFFSDPEIALVVLDVMMPVYDGWEVLKEIRQQSDVLVLMLTALGDENHQVAGLSKGADDYMSKPFSYQVLIAKINAMMRKVKLERTQNITAGNLMIHQSDHKVYLKESEIQLSNKEYRVLIYLIKNKGNILSREQILNAVWSYDFDGDIRTVDTHIKTLRAKLGEYGKCIGTVRGSGYLFEVNHD